MQQNALEDSVAVNWLTSALTLGTYLVDGNANATHGFIFWVNILQDHLACIFSIFTEPEFSLQDQPSISQRVRTRLISS